MPEASCRRRGAERHDICPGAQPSSRRRDSAAAATSNVFRRHLRTYDRASAQRGFQVYKEVCSVCHPVKHLFFRDLEDLGYSEDEVKSDRLDLRGHRRTKTTQGQNYQRPARPPIRYRVRSRTILAARAANNGALPPDLSMIVKAREGGPDYVFGLLTGYKDPPAASLLPGMYYNEYFPGHQIAMPPPLSDNAVTFADGTSATVPANGATTWSPS